MYTIHKHYLNIGKETVLELPITSTVLSVGEQDGGLVVWVFVNDEDPKVECRFWTEGTGWNLGHLADVDSLKFVDTVQSKDGLVWHVFTDCDFVRNR